MEMLCIGRWLTRRDGLIGTEEPISYSDRESCGWPQASDRCSITFSFDFPERVADRPDECSGGHDWWRSDFSLHADFHQKVGESPQVVQ